MSYLGQPFTHDVFVSYSHGDAEGTGDTPLKRWSQAFRNELAAEFATIQLAGARIFLDEDRRPGRGVGPMEPLTEQLRSACADSALLVVLMTPQYLASDWCHQERAAWSEAAHLVKSTAGGRLAVVKILPTDGSQWPDLLKDEAGVPLVGVDFIDSTAAAALAARPYEWPDPTGKGGPFRAKLLELVGHLAPKLKTLRKDLEDERRRQAELDRLAAPDGQVLYLHARREHRDLWEVAYDALEGSQFAIYPNEPEMVEGDLASARKVAQERVEKMTACDGVLLLGGADRGALERDLLVIGRTDRSLARAQSGKRLPCAVLDAAPQDPALERRRRAARRLDIDWLEASAGTDWPQSVRRWLSGVADPAQESA